MKKLEIEKLVRLEMLNLSEKESKISNPLLKWTREDLENPGKTLLRILRKPEYIYLSSKILFGIQLLPYQPVILEELWKRPFPMLVDSRGMGKSFLLALHALRRAAFIQGRKVVITGAGFRQAKTIMNYVETVWFNSPVLRSLFAENQQSGPHHDADRWWFRLGDSTITALPLGDGGKIRGERAHDVIADEFACVDASTIVETKNGMVRIGDYVNDNMTVPVLVGNGVVMETPKERVRTPLTDAYKVTTIGGYEFICSDKHEVKTTNGWKVGKQLQIGDMLVVANTGYFPANVVIKKNLWLDEHTAWLMGILLAEGSINSNSCLSVHMTDKDCADRIVSAWEKINARPYVYERQAYVDKRGWHCKQSYTVNVTDKNLREEFVCLGLDRATAINKKIPWSIFASPRKIIVQFLSGLFEGDGSAFLWTDKDITNRFSIAYYSVSEQLCREVQILLKKLGIFSIRQSRSSKLSDNPQWMLRINGEYALRLQELLEIPKWQDMYQMAYRPSENRYRGVVWDKSRKKWKAETTVYGKKKYLGRFTSQEEAISAIVEAERELEDYLKVRSVEKLSDQRELYDFHIPESHSFVGNGFIQHNSIPRETFETVVGGFSVVELDPYEKVKREAEISVYKKLGLWTPDMEENQRVNRLGNQTVISGTAYYQFNHFAEYWKKWKGIIESGGDVEKLKVVLGQEPEPGFDWRDYSIIRIPVHLLPKGYMDARQVARSKASVHSGTYLNEFGAVFSTDTNGFFKRSLIESCVTNSPILIGDESVQFRAVVRGNPNLRYVYGIDPASEQDKFCIIVMELHETHQRIVYCWTFDKKEHTKRVNAGLDVEKDFYAYCARKIRELMKVFPCEHIAMDSQGGGVSIREALHDPDKLASGEKPLWEIRGDHPLSWEKKPKPTDDYAGLHMIELVNFARADYVSEANHGLRKDFEDKVCLFPMSNDTTTLAIAFEADQLANRQFDTYEDCFNEIQELKEELATITHTQTPGSNRDKWDTPEIKIAGSRKGRLRKDRYSALLIANMAARRIHRKPAEVVYESFGGFVGAMNPSRGGPDYVQAPDWFLKPINSKCYGRIVRRSV